MKGVVAGLVLVAALIGAACTSTPRAAESESTPITLPFGRAEVTALATRFETGGVVRAHGTALIASRLVAPIIQVHVRPGDRIRRGAALVTLDARDIHANRVRVAAASLSAAESARAAEADVRSVDAALVLAHATQQRMAALHAKGSSTAQEFDQAVAGLAAAEAQAASARARLAAAQAARDAARAASESADVGATYAVLSAPFDGVVTQRHADAGSMAMPGATLLMLEDQSAFRLETPVDEARASLVAAGQTVDVRLDNAAAGAGEWIPARVVEIARVDPASHSFLVKIDLPHASTLRSGLFGRARFGGPSRRALTVPASALVTRGQLTFVFVLGGEDRAWLRPISAGTAGEDRVEVLAGAREGDMVVTNPPGWLSDGTRITGVRR